MCGRKPCAKCKRARLGARKKRTMARRRSKKISVRNLTSLAMEGVAVGAGMAAGKAISNNIPQLSANPVLGMGVQLVGAVILSGMGGTFVKGMASGMAAGAVTQGVVALAPGLAPFITGLGAGGSYYVPGVGARSSANGPVIRVQ